MTQENLQELVNSNGQVLFHSKLQLLIFLQTNIIRIDVTHLILK